MSEILFARQDEISPAVLSSLATYLAGITGDVTFTGSGPFTSVIGPLKVTSAMLNADVFSTDHSWTGVQTFTDPVLGDASATTINKLTITEPATGATLTIDDGFTLHVSGDTTLSGSNTGDQTITLTGDVTGSGTGTFAATLATVNSNVGSFGGASSVPNFTVNGKGLVTAAGQTAVVAPAGTLSGTTLASGVVSSSLTSVGTLTGGATGAGFTVALSTSTITGTLAAARLPQFTGGDVTTSGAGSVNLTIGNGVVTNAKMVNIAAFSLKGNNTSSSASGTDINPSALTHKSTLSSGDILLIQDSAASNVFKYATVGDIGAAAGAVSSVGGITGAVGLNSADLAASGSNIQLSAARQTHMTQSILTSGTSYSTPTGCLYVFVEAQGAGGGGKSVTSSASQTNVGSGGGGGGYTAKLFAAGTYSMAVGAGGGPGTSGGDTTFSTMTAGGGGGATCDTGSGTTAGRPSCTGNGGTATGGTINIPGKAGAWAFRYSGSEAIGPFGGDSVMGIGGAPTVSSGAAQGGQGYGGGGAGAVGLNGASGTGGSGANGVIRVWEFYN